MKKVIMIGKIGCGKTTLSQRLLGEEVRYQKTQAVCLAGEDIIDVPGEYLEQKQFYKALIVTAVDAEVILLLASAADELSAFSPRMGAMFAGKRMIGVITKTDLCTNPAQIENARMILELAGASEIVEVGFGDDAGVRQLLARIDAEEEERCM